MTVEVTHDLGSQVVRIAVRGEVDISNAGELQQHVLDALRRHRPRSVVVDLTGVTFLDSIGINTLLVSRSDAHHMGCQFILASAGPAVHRVLDIVGLTEIFGLTGPSTDATARDTYGSAPRQPSGAMALSSPTRRSAGS